MKKLAALIFVAIIFALTLTSCSASVSADSIKSGLKNAGYTVDTYDKNTFESAQLSVTLETSKMEGLTAVIYAYKTVNDRTDGILVLVFDSIDHASISNENLGLMNSFGRRHAPESDTSVVGTHNNTVWAGSQAARKAAGLYV